MTKGEGLKISRSILVAWMCVLWALGSLGCGGGGTGLTDWDDILEPKAKAGHDQNVVTGALVTLDGSRSDSFDDKKLFYEWSFISVPSGSSATLSDPTAVRTTFVADVDGLYVARLVVSIGDYMDSDSVQITATSDNSAPIANAGEDQNVVTGGIVTLGGSASSDANNDPLSYNWSLVSRPVASVASLSTGNLAESSFVADVDGSFVIGLVVDDGTDSSTIDLVVINAAADNSIPIANAGPDQEVVQAGVVTLDGRASSDANNDFLNYSWVFISKPSGSRADLSDSDTANPSFTADMNGFYVIRLVVDDGLDNSLPDNVTVMASGRN